MSQYGLPKAYEKNPLLHAYLVLSADYNVRSLTAKAIAKSMLCTGKNKEGAQPCGECPHCIKMDAGTHPDCILVGKSGKTSVDNVRAIADEAYLAPNEGDCKVFVLENADEYNVQSQNALLKIIEEPPANVKFVLTASSVASILPTVRSRVCTLTQELPSAQVILQQVKEVKKEISGKELESIAAFVASFDKTAASELDEKLVFEYKELAVRFFSNEESQPVSKFPVKREELMLCLQVFMLTVEEICLIKNGIKPALGFLTEDERVSCIRRTSLRKAHILYDVLEKGYILAEEYANVNATVSYLWQSIR